MAMTEQELNEYEAQLRGEGDEAAYRELNRTQNPYDYPDNQSMTNSVNKYNYARREDYLKALKAREDIALNWKNANTQAQLAQAQIGDMARQQQARLAQAKFQEKELGSQESRFKKTLGETIASRLAENERHKKMLEARRQELKMTLGDTGKTRAQQWKVHQDLYNLRKEEQELMKEKQAHEIRQSKERLILEKTLLINNEKLARGQLDRDKWLVNTNAALQMLGIQIDKARLDALLESGRMPQGELNDAEALNILSEIMTQNNARRGLDAGIVANQQNAAYNRSQLGLQAQTMKYQNRLALMQLNSQTRRSLIDTMVGGGLGLVGLFL